MWTAVTEVIIANIKSHTIRRKQSSSVNLGAASICDALWQKPPGIKCTAGHWTPQQSLSGTWSHPLNKGTACNQADSGTRPLPPCQTVTTSTNEFGQLSDISWAWAVIYGNKWLYFMLQLAFQTRQEVHHCVSHQGDICKKLLRSLQHAGLHKFTFIEGFWRERSVASNKVTGFYRINRFDIRALSEHRLLFPSTRQQFSHLLWFCCPSVLLYAPAWSAHSGDVGWILPAVKCAANTPDTQAFPGFPWIEEQTFFLVMMVAKRRPSSISAGTA